jgi:glycogen phosphorylase
VVVSQNKEVPKKMSQIKNRENFINNPVAYFCAEYALIDHMPTYAGGLGILAGDYILEAAAQDFPLVGFGLYYNKGQNGQTKDGEPNGAKFGLKLVRQGFFKKKLLISIPIQDRDVFAQIWQWKKKNNSVYFLDTNIMENNPEDRKITEQLYVEDRELRLRQELVLGIGGVRLLRKLKIDPSVYHMNEGHSAFLLLELDKEEAKKKVVFTNHTLVLEGQEMFAFDSLKSNTAKLCADLNIDINEIIEKGRLKPEDKLFSMTSFALNGARVTNAVSKIHGEKARELWPTFRIIHITNGIYIPRWDKINSKDIIKEHQKNEEKLLKLIRETHGDDWKKEALLIGWSRRFVPYKRPLALLEDVEKLKNILNHFKGQVHIVYSAPLDMADAEKNEFLKKINELMNGDLKGYLTFIPHYRIEIAEILTAGCDIWLNTPIVGREACGTSGMKASLNGTLSISTNDGWINEVPLNDFGWIIDDQNITDNLLQKIQTDIMPKYNSFVQRDKNSVWEQYMIKAREIILRDFSTTRMLQEYVDKLYLNKEGKKLIAFDVDNTLSKSRSKIDTEMADLLNKLLQVKKVAIITGGAFADIKKQILSGIGLNNPLNKNLILLPTNGAGLWVFDKEWKEISCLKLTSQEKEKVINAIKQVDQADPELANNISYGSEIQDRGSQITYTALGDHAPHELKMAWDPDFKKRLAIQNKLEKLLPDFEVKIGGTTSIDITAKGIDKAYAVQKLMDHFQYTKDDILFFGDAVYENGNDYPVYLSGIDTIKVTGPEETKERLIRLLENAII